MTNKQTAQDKIASLVTRFEEQYQSYKNSDYNETLTRRDFIDPFFKALGWDIDNEAGYAEAYREVIHEDKVKVSGATKAPDYSFRLGGGKRLFFVEAKKPSVSVKDDIHPAYQIRRYGWSAKMPISIITDFEEFSIYDCTKKPKPEDKAAVARIKFLSFRDYIKEFDFLWDTFSKEQVLKGSFDRFLLSDTHKKGTATVDKDFLESLDRWRTYLAVNISWNNRTLDEDEINFVVQQTIDRIIFLRIAEDRSIEPYGTLKHSIKQGNLYQNLFELFQRADEKYNSGLFDFKKDKISRNVVVENKIIRTIINELYYPECPYEFSVLSVEILGSAYEQFLGKVIRITPAHHAKIEEKPEVRKAGGVYYTPQYIVDYIVKNTVGKLIEGKTPKEISKIKILDPACGSGSFLIGAFHYLLDYHKDYYSENGKPPKGKKDNPLTPDGHLTTAEKKRILINNIYGVDLDANAAEVTKLSLLIKCLEGETEASIQQQFDIWSERVLPTLENNIKSGNSLIDTDFYDNQIDFGFEKRIKPFNWQNSFPQIFQNGGFDIVIGNPPWGAEFDQECLNYLREKNKAIIVRMIDSFMYFVFRSNDLLRTDGIFGMILPDVLLYQTGNLKLREFLLDKTTINSLLNLGNVFDKVTRPTCIILFTNTKPIKSSKILTIDLSDKKKEIKQKEIFKKENFKTISQSKIKSDYGSLFLTSNEDHYSIINRINKLEVVNLSEYIDDDGIQRGVSPDLKEAFLVTKSQIKEFKLEKSHLKSVLTGGKHVKRFHIQYPDLYLIYTDRTTNFKSIPNICKFIEQYKSRITCKEVKDGKHSIYSLHRAREEKIFTKTEKLCGVITEDEIIVAYDPNKIFVTDGLYIFGVKNINIKFLMGILNSSLFIFLYRLLTMEKGRVLAQVKPTALSKMPIVVINETDKTELSIREEIIKNVESLETLYPKLYQINVGKEQLQARIDYHTAKINEIVFRLYGLSEDEIDKVKKSV
jgi:adenine-specific DNA-methyltransferase